VVKTKKAPAVRTRRKARRRDDFASSQYEDARGRIDDLIALQAEADPVLGQLDGWAKDRSRFRLAPQGEALAIVPASEGARATWKEGLIFGSDVMGVPQGNASAIARYRAENRGLTPMSNTMVGLGSTDFYELIRLASWMLLHNPFAKNVVRALTYLTVGQGVTVAWPESRNGSGTKKEKRWLEIERVTGFQRQVRRIAGMAFGLGEWFVVPTIDKRRGGTLPNRLLHVEPDRVSRIFVSDSDAEDVIGYEIEGATKAMVGKGADDVIHAKVEDFGNVCRGITPMLAAMKYLRFLELFLESRHYLNLTRSRIPVVRQVKGSSAQIAREKARFVKLPPPGTIAIDPESVDWKFPTMNVNAADASEDFQRCVLAVASSVGLPAHMVANDVSQGTYASTLIAESPTIRMIDDFRAFFMETWLGTLVRRLSGQDDGFNMTFAQVIKRSIGENAQAVSVLVDREVLSRKTACEHLGYDWEGADGEQERIETERDDGFGTGGGFGFEPFSPQKTELPNTRAPEPSTGAALGAKGSTLPKQSAAG
jgi:hypothetical protein